MRMPSRRSRLFAFALLIAAAAMLCLRAEWSRRHLRERGALWDAKYPPVAPWTPPQGFAHFADVDGNYWHLYALEMARTGRWRVRHVDYDNAPFGREMHWSSSYAWWLIALSWTRTVAAGGTVVENLPWASDWGEVILHALVAALFAAILWRRAGPVPAALGALLFSTLEAPARDFAFGRPDHHGMQDAAMLLLAACMARGLWPGEERARLWMAASGALAGVALWLGATFGFIPALAAACGGMALPWLLRDGADAIRTMPLWRWWGCTGALVSLLFYAIEYAPGPWPFRLETNHPLYALALAGLGELAARTQSLRRAPREALHPGFLLATLAVVQLPVTILLLPVSLYTPRDPVIKGLVAIGQESSPILSAEGPEHLCYFGAIALVLFAVAALRWRHREDGMAAHHVPLLALALIACMLGGAMMRAAGLTAAGALMAWVFTRSPAMPRRLRAVEIFSLSLAASGAAWAFAASRPAAPTYTSVEADWHAVRDVALVLRDQGGPPPLVMTDNSNTNYVFLHDIAGGRIVSALFWECTDGLRDMRDFWLATDDAEALRICRRRGVTHVLLNARPGLIATQLAAGGIEPDPADMRRRMVARLVLDDLAPPPWLRRVDLPGTHALLGSRTRLYRVEPPAP